jgi:hypothetical protein
MTVLAIPADPVAPPRRHRLRAFLAIPQGLAGSVV